MSLQQNEPYIRGYADLSDFLTRAGYPIVKTTLGKLGMGPDGPPIARSWGNSYLFDKSDVLKWAEERAAKSQPHKTRKLSGVPLGRPRKTPDALPLLPPSPPRLALPPPPEAISQQPEVKPASISARAMSPSEPALVLSDDEILAW
jgi:hypothetical protein